MQAFIAPLARLVRYHRDSMTGTRFKVEIVLCWSSIDGVFVADVPQLPGCMAHGDTREAALDSVNRAMDLWVDTAREFGDPVPEPRANA